MKSIKHCGCYTKLHDSYRDEINPQYNMTGNIPPCEVCLMPFKAWQGISFSPPPFEYVLTPNNIRERAPWCRHEFESFIVWKGSDYTLYVETKQIRGRFGAHVTKDITWNISTWQIQAEKLPSTPLSWTPPNLCMTRMAFSIPSLVCSLLVRGSGGGR